jgi:hypothetical protein
MGLDGAIDNVLADFVLVYFSLLIQSAAAQRCDAQKPNILCAPAT